MEVGFFFKDFIYLFDREIARERGNTAGEWEKKKQAPSGEARCETRSRNVEITHRAVGRRLTTVLTWRSMEVVFNLDHFYLSEVLSAQD